MEAAMTCPECSAEADRDTVDVGVGIMHGPWGCYECGWSEDERYNHNPDPKIDPLGGYTP